MIEMIIKHEKMKCGKEIALKRIAAVSILFFIIASVAIPMGSLGDSNIRNSWNFDRLDDLDGTPSAPRNLAALARDYGVDLRWMEPSDDGGSEITSYIIYWDTESGDLPNDIELDGDRGDYEHEGLQGGVTYYYRVSAVNEFGEGELSEEVSATTTGTEISSVETELSVSPTVGRPPLEVTIYVSAENEGTTDSSLDVVIDGDVVHTLVVPGGGSSEYEFTRTFVYDNIYHIQFGEERETVMVSDEGFVDTGQTALTYQVASLLFGLIILVTVIFVYLRMNKKGEEEKTNYGDEKKFYYGITIVGTVLMIAGAVIYAGYHFLTLSEPYNIIGIIFIAIGIFTIVPGLAGYHEEKRLEGEEKKSVNKGIYSVIIGIIGVFLLTTPIIPIIFGVIAIILGKMAMDEGDNQYGLGGVILGCANIIISLLLTFLFL